MSSIELKTLLPLLAPFITIFLGIITIPFIENIKNHFERKRLIYALREELKDEIVFTLKDFEELFPSYEYALNKKNGGKTGVYDVIVPARIVLFSANELLNKHYQYLHPHVRQSLKNITLLIEPLNLLTEELHDLYHEALQNNEKDNPKLQKLIDLLNGYLCNMLSLRYNMAYLFELLLNNSTDLKIYYEIDFDDSIQHQLQEMNKKHYYRLLRD